MSLRVDEVYGYAALHGAPSLGKRKFGVPPGGAFDPGAQADLNATLGNAVLAAVLELALCRLTLTALATISLAWDGRAGVLVDGSRFPGLASQISAGSQIIFEIPETGARAWVAAAGGFAPTSAEPLARGDILRADPAGRDTPLELVGSARGTGETGPLRAIPGQRRFARLFDTEYRVDHASNRVGIRLIGPRMRHTLELPSEPATPGVVQITPEGLPIILGPDGPTIGGYPRAAVVVSADLARLAQLRPGDGVNFVPTT